MWTLEQIIVWAGCDGNRIEQVLGAMFNKLQNIFVLFHIPNPNILYPFRVDENAYTKYWKRVLPYTKRTYESCILL